jgi:hypothetical protein
MRYFRVVNLEKHQHYKKRRPPWIKLHAEVLDDYDFLCLQDASKAHAMLLWVLASKMDNRIPYDADFIARKIGATVPVDLEALVAQGFIELIDDASGVLASRKQSALPETEREAEAEGESETEKTDDIRKRVREALPEKYRTDLDSLLDTGLGKPTERESWLRSLHAVLFDGYEFPSRDPEILGQGLREMLGTQGAPTWQKYSGFVRRLTRGESPPPTRANGSRIDPAIELAAGKQLEEIIKLGVRVQSAIGVGYQIPPSKLQELPAAVKSAIAALGGSLASGAQRILDTPPDKYGILLSQFAKLYAGAISVESARVGAHA